jgi:murein DD-endopeptidase MepM/ murein hydrolase activator NlpD
MTFRNKVVTARKQPGLLPFIQGAFALCCIPLSTYANHTPKTSDTPALEPRISAAVYSGNAFTGSGVTSTILVPTLASYGTDTALSEPYTETGVTDITTYTVKSGDTIDSIAKFFNISRNTIRWQNDIPSKGAIKSGQKLIILPITGVLHTVQKGDTLSGIAKKYEGTVSGIMRFNDLSSNRDLVVGMKIIIPEGEKNETVAKKEDPKKKTSILQSIKKVFTKPFIRGKWNSRELVVNGYMHPSRFSGIKTQGYHHAWRAIDIGMPVGTPIYASRSGTVAIANASGWGGGYGHYVIIKHNNGSLTMYAHLSKVSVSAGESVSQGDQIGKSGNTGSSTGPHLHFEIRPPSGKSVATWFPIPW